MKLIPFVFAVLLYSCNFAHAQETKNGIGPLCNTAEQMEQAVNDGGFVKVNEPKPVCAVVAVSYIRGAEVKKVVYKGSVYAITEISVVGIYVEGSLHTFPPEKQYTLFKTDDKEI